MKTNRMKTTENNKYFQILKITQVCCLTAQKTIMMKI